MVEYCEGNLREIQGVLKNMNNTQYNAHIELLSNSTIGQHLRHILEFYLSLLHGMIIGKVNYDNRERNIQFECDIKCAIDTIDKICYSITLIDKDIPLELEGNFSSTDCENIVMQSSIMRELAYCLEHSIHHQALIKIGLIELDLQRLVNKTFGLAPATIKHRLKCAQ